MRFILRFRKESKKTTNASKITIDRKEAKNDIKETKETRVKVRKTKASTRVNARATTTIVTTTTTITNKKRSSKLRERFICIYISFVFETTSILLSYLLLFNNSRECASNTLYS